MKENIILKPIPFKTEMVQAIDEGRKTMTRRIMKPQPKYIHGRWFYHNKNQAYGLPTVSVQGDFDTFLKQAEPLLGLWNVAPYQVGNILWVRESWQHGAAINSWDMMDKIIFKALRPELDTKWKPGMFLKKTDARLFLEITDVKVERLTNISEEDAIKEGIEKYIYSGRTSYYAYKDYLNRKPESEDDILDAIGSFKSLWESINGTGSWALNPWCWCYTFKKIKNPLA